MVPVEFEMDFVGLAEVITLPRLRRIFEKVIFLCRMQRGGEDFAVMY